MAETLAAVAFVCSVLATTLLPGVAPPTPEPDQEPTLQEIFDAYFGPGVIDTTKETGRETFPAGLYEAVLIARETSEREVPIGWYPVADSNVRIEIFAATDAPGAVVTTTVPTEFGLWAATFEVWYSQASLNSDSVDHYVVFDGPSGGFAMGIEDIPGGGDNDFQDHVLFIRPLQRRELWVALDVKPGSCPNPFNMRAKGVLPAAILGAADFDVAQVDVTTIRMEGVAPLRWATEDVAAPFLGDLADVDDCTTDGPDGFVDLTLKFDRRAIAAALGTVTDRQAVVVRLTGTLLDGTPIAGEDVIWVLVP